jgi:hypothetical protein
MAANWRSPWTRMSNVPEWLQLFQIVADIRMGSYVPELERLKPRVVGGEASRRRIYRTAAATPELIAFMGQLAERVEHLGPQRRAAITCSKSPATPVRLLSTCDHLESAGPTGVQPVPAELIERFVDSSAPQTGTPPDAILREFAERIEPYPFGNGHPGFFAWVHSPPVVLGRLRRRPGRGHEPQRRRRESRGCLPERQVVGWLRELLGFPIGGMGLLVSGGSTATLTALAIARHVAAHKFDFDVRVHGLQDKWRRMVVNASQEVHSSTRKAIELLGIGSANSR